MPGQRVLVFVSPGFLQTTIQSEASELVDRATRANIVINTIDARGLYAPDVMGDIASPSQDTYRTAGYKASYGCRAIRARRRMAQLADDGRHAPQPQRRDAAMREAARRRYPIYWFSPQNLKTTGAITR
jgi:hypothetical protein